VIFIFLLLASGIFMLVWTYRFKSLSVPPDSSSSVQRARTVLRVGDKLVQKKIQHWIPSRLLIAWRVPNLC
jgi:hypothetical protein